MMGKNILILTASARQGGNSNLMARAFREEAERAGHTVEVFDTAAHRILPCRACDQCFSAGRACVFADDFALLSPLLERADTLVLAMPLYWYTFPASIKAALDKLYAFIVGGKTLPIKEAVLLICGEIAEERVFEGAVRSYELILEDRGWKDSGRLVVPGVNKAGEIKETDALDRARALARSL